MDAIRASLLARQEPGPDVGSMDDLSCFLVFLAHSFNYALEGCHMSVAASYAKVQTSFEHIAACEFSSVEARCQELRSDIDAAEAAIVSELERAIVTIDDALERWNDVQIDIHQSVTLAGCDFPTLLHGLKEYTGAAGMFALPVDYVHPTRVAIIFDAPPLTTTVMSAGRVLSYHALTPLDAVLDDIYVTREKLHFRLAIIELLCAQSEESLMFSFEQLAGDLVVESLVQVPAHMSVNLVDRYLQGSVLVSLCSAVTVSLSLAGVMIRRVDINDIPFVFGMRSPLMLRTSPPRLLIAMTQSCSPCMSLDGTLYIPQDGSTTVSVYDCDGAVLPSVDLRALGLGAHTTCAALTTGTEPLLLLGESHGMNSHVVAMDVSTRTVAWREQAVFEVEGLAILNQKALFVVGDKQILFRCLLSGKLLGHTYAGKSQCFAAADDGLCRVFSGTMYSPAKYGIHSWSWLEDAVLADAQAVQDAGVEPHYRPVIVMPAARDGRHSYLIVGTIDSPLLRVLSLPDLRLVHSHVLEGMQVTGLAADPNGTSFVVCDAASQAVHVLAWPVPGMP